MTIEWTDDQKRAALVINDAFNAERDGVFVVGPTGCGKTLICTEVARGLAHGTHRRGNEDWPNRVELNCLNAAFEAHAAMSKAHGARTAWEIIEEAKRASVVLLDDAGRERGDHGRDLVFSLIDQAGGFLIITSNRSKKELCDLYGGDEGLRSRLSALVLVEFPKDAPNLRKRGEAEKASEG